MISGVTIEVAGETETLRMSTRAMMALEDIFGMGMIDIMTGFEKGFRVSDIARIIAECANDGAGADIARAQVIIDTLGAIPASEAIGRVAEAAFPEVKEAGNPPKGRAPKKA
ncbi:hypothetical protein BYZ73_19875 [Rhodovulum viride]|uniref:Tail tube GTA-gp10-like protein n=1 Tax=Rhodovulum viride TaxID=1231134 RepID=A0ABX9DB65_9RHOB|nr:GTA-gp10 family protein [Rhodovulum viride]RAP39565.1 hypothetical protein BYZ73_19875 [Rhodovulum viride]